MNRRFLTIIALLLLALVISFFLPSVQKPADAKVEEAEAPAEMTPTAPSLSPEPTPTPFSETKSTPSVNQRAIQQTKEKQEIGYRELEFAFVSNKVCDFAKAQELLPLEMTVKVLLHKGARTPSDRELQEILTRDPSAKSSEAKFFRALELAGLDQTHATPNPDLRAAEKILRSLNIESPNNIAYIVFLYEVLKLKGETLPDLADELRNHGTYDPHLYDLKRTLQMKGGTTTSLHAAALVEKELPRPNFSKIVQTLEDEIRFSAKDGALAIVTVTERVLQEIEKRKPLALTEYPLDDDLVPRKLNELARNYLLLESRDYPVPGEPPPTHSAVVHALKEERDEQDQITKHCEKRLADKRYEWLRKHY